MLFRPQKAPIDRLVDGYRKFRRTTFPSLQRDFRRLAKEGQSPKILLIGCADSRVSPNLIFATPPGTMFVARNVGNIVPPHDPNTQARSIGAAIEYAVKVLAVTDIVIKGHARCGGVAAMLNRGVNLPETDYLKPWVEIAEPARMLLPADYESLSEEKKRLASELAVIQNSIMNLSGFPWVRERLEAGMLKIHGLHFDMHDGSLMRLDHESGEWAQVR
ncbi:MAG: carbonic anhydrase [Alphaproteobacteria bacterium]|nr:carbonic anhydrase [Alphaproteobacteria bacterium]